MIVDGLACPWTKHRDLNKWDLARMVSAAFVVESKRFESIDVGCCQGGVSALFVTR